jgi:hypothetical protein
MRQLTFEFTTANTIKIGGSTFMFKTTVATQYFCWIKRKFSDVFVALFQTDLHFYIDPSL